MLDHAIFSQLTAGPLNPNIFAAGNGAHDADDRIIYYQTTGELFYDVDGAGGVSAQLIARFLGSPEVIASDFIVI